MSASTSSSQAGMISLIVLSVSTGFLLTLTAVAAWSELGPFICVMAQLLGLPPLAA